MCLLGAACGSDGGTGPQLKNVTGTYTYSVPNLNTVGLACQVHATMTVSQGNAAFTGSYTGTVICTAASGTDTLPAAGSVVNGSVKGDSVFFDLDGSDWHDMGTIVGSGMQGLVNVHLTVNGSPTVVAGDFTCVKQ